MEVEVAVLGSPSHNMVSVGVIQHWKKKTEEVIKTGTIENQRMLGR